MTELKTEHILMVLIMAFVLYNFMGRCGNGFSVGGKGIVIKPESCSEGEELAFEEMCNPGYYTNPFCWISKINNCLEWKEVNKGGGSPKDNCCS